MHSLTELKTDFTLQIQLVNEILKFKTMILYLMQFAEPWA